jgi:hypothetical protein
VTTTEGAERARRAVVNGLDVVAVRIEHEGGEIARAVGALARPAVVAAAGGERRFVEGADRRPVGGPEGEVHPAHGAVRTVDEQLIRGEMVRLVRRQLPPERPEGGAVEAAARLQVGDAEVKVVDEAAEMVVGQDRSPTESR